MSGVVRKSVLSTDNGEALKPEPRGHAAAAGIMIAEKRTPGLVLRGLGLLAGK